MYDYLDFSFACPGGESSAKAPKKGMKGGSSGKKQPAHKKPAAKCPATGNCATALKTITVVNNRTAMVDSLKKESKSWSTTVQNKFYAYMKRIDVLTHKGDDYKTTVTMINKVFNGFSNQATINIVKASTIHLGSCPWGTVAQFVACEGKF